jgi:uncharacterized glyoxalase superfamily protein PhnB
MHAMIRIGGSAVMLADEMPEWGSLGPKASEGLPRDDPPLRGRRRCLRRPRAAKAGAKVTMPVADMFWGDRYGKIEDPFGHHWSVGTHVRDVTPQEMQQAMKEMARRRRDSWTRDS